MVVANATALLEALLRSRLPAMYCVLLSFGAQDRGLVHVA